MHLKENSLITALLPQAAMVSYLLIGISYALSAGLQPGPLQAFYLAQVSKQGWKRTLPAAFAPLLSDGPIALISIIVLQAVPDNFRNWLQLAGGLLLVVFARSAFDSWRRPAPLAKNPDQASSGSIFQAALINLLNPNPYLGWSLVMGPAVIAAWKDNPWFAAALLLSFYITMISTSLLLIYLMGQAVQIGSTTRRTFSLISALLLLGLGVYFLIQAGGGLLEVNL